jgi:hypothetical protein
MNKPKNFTYTVGDGYALVLTALDQQTLQDFITAEKLADKTPEDKIEALMTQGGALFSACAILKNGLRNDGPNGEPAVQCWSAPGVLKMTGRMRDDIPNSSFDGDFGMTQHYPDGALMSGWHYRNGKDSNGPPPVNAPMHQQFAPDGTLVAATELDPNRRDRELDVGDMLEFLQREIKFSNRPLKIVRNRKGPRHEP